jgi:DNA adenine methylase
MYPNDLKDGKIKNYFEPFLGGGAVFFDIIQNYQVENIFISDINEKLIKTYKTIKNESKELIEILKEYENQYITLDKEKQQEYFYNKRKQFNDEILTDLITSALFIFLNKTCYNGLYRVNSKNKFNTPIGSYIEPKICDENNLKNVSILLENVNIEEKNYTKILENITENSFVYFDPPYRPLNKDSFKSYDTSNFNDKEQEKLADFFNDLNKINPIYLMLSNSDPKNSDENDNFFDELYKDYNIYRIDAKRFINSKALKRDSIKELLITNY